MHKPDNAEPYFPNGFHFNYQFSNSASYVGNRGSSTYLLNTIIFRSTTIRVLESVSQSVSNLLLVYINWVCLVDILGLSLIRVIIIHNI